MSLSEQNPPHRTFHAGRWYWIGGIALLLVIGAAIALSIVVSHAQPIVRERVIETLSTKFKAKVELDEFNVSLLQVKGCEFLETRIRTIMSPEFNR
jgi:hypothetical protein